MKFQLKNVRLSFPQLWKATQVVEGEGKPAFSASFLISPDDPQVDEIEKIIEQCIEEACKNNPAKWGTNPKVAVSQLRAQDRTCLHNGDMKSQYEGFTGMYFVSARTPTKPLVLDRITKKADGTANILTEADGRPYGGCYVNASIDIYAHIHPKGGKRVNASLRGVQFVGDGDAFTGGPPATPEEFDDLSTDATELA